MNNQDVAESSSLTPEIKRRQDTNTTYSDGRIKQFEYGHKGDSVALKRFAIMPNETKSLIGKDIDKNAFNEIERTVFDLALKELNTSKFVVLADFFKRSDNPKKQLELISEYSNTGFPETHTICLWKGLSNGILVIDPNKSDFSEFISTALKNIEKIENIETYQHSGKKFYSSNLINPTGIGKFDKRDCIDIAVKIAFEIIDSTKSEETEERTKARIASLSNQKAVNNLLGKGLDGTILRELQSSDITKRKEALGLIKNNKDYIETIQINSFEDLQELEKRKSEQDFSEKIQGLKEHKFEKILISKLDPLSILQNEIENFNNKLAQLGILNYKAKIDKFSSSDANTQKDILFKVLKEGKVQEILNILNQFSRSVLKTLVDSVDEYGQTALHWAAGKGYADISNMLIDNMNNEYIAKFAIGHSNYTALHMAVHSNNLEIVQYLLSKKIPGITEAQDIHGQTALHWAAGKGYVDISNMLIDNMNNEYIAKPATGHFNYTALHMAVHSNNLEIVQYLLSKKIPGITEAQDIHGQTALHWAAGKGYADISKLLIDEMKDEDIAKPATGHLDYTVLHSAVYGGSEEIIKYLLNKKIPGLIEAQDIYGQTAYFIAHKRFVEIELIFNKHCPPVITTTQEVEELKILCNNIINDSDDLIQNTQSLQDFSYKETSDNSNSYENNKDTAQSAEITYLGEATDISH